MPYIEHCDENVPYIVGSVLLSAMDIDGYYVGSFPYHKQQPTVFVLMDELHRHSDFKVAFISMLRTLRLNLSHCAV